MNVIVSEGPLPFYNHLDIFSLDPYNNVSKRTKCGSVAQTLLKGTIEKIFQRGSTHLNDNKISTGTGF